MTLKESLNEPVTMKRWQFQLALFTVSIGSLIVEDFLHWI